VAYHEAIAIKRRQRNDQNALDQLKISTEEPPEADFLVAEETQQAVRQAISTLEPALKQVLHLRIYEEKTFAQIAQQLKIPLGTALGRMRNALAKLKSKLDSQKD